MPISIANKPQLAGIIILFAGVALLAFTFINAFLFLQEPFSIIAAGDLSRVFGEALAPLIQACIRLMYLGIMGWIGSLLTMRGIPLVTFKRVPIVQSAPTPKVSRQAETVKQPQKVPPRPTQPTPVPSARTQTLSRTPYSPPQSRSTPGEKPKMTPEQSPSEPKAVLIPPENRGEQ